MIVWDSHRVAWVIRGRHMRRDCGRGDHFGETAMPRGSIDKDTSVVAGSRMYLVAHCKERSTSCGLSTVSRTHGCGQRQKEG